MPRRNLNKTAGAFGVAAWIFRGHAVSRQYLHSRGRSHYRISSPGVFALGRKLAGAVLPGSRMPLSSAASRTRSRGIERARRLGRSRRRPMARSSHFASVLNDHAPIYGKFRPIHTWGEHSWSPTFDAVSSRTADHGWRSSSTYIYTELAVEREQLSSRTEVVRDARMKIRESFENPLEPRDNQDRRHLTASSHLVVGAIGKVARALITCGRLGGLLFSRLDRNSSSDPLQERFGSGRGVF